MANNLYSVGYAPTGQSRCKNCREKILTDDLRIVKTTEGSYFPFYYHAAHFFMEMKRFRSGTARVDATTDLENYAHLKNEDKKTIKRLIKESNAFQELKEQANRSKPRPRQKPERTQKHDEKECVAVGGECKKSIRDADKKAFRGPKSSRLEMEEKVWSIKISNATSSFYTEWGKLFASPSRSKVKAFEMNTEGKMKMQTIASALIKSKLAKGYRYID